MQKSMKHEEHMRNSIQTSVAYNEPPPAYTEVTAPVVVPSAPPADLAGPSSYHTSLHPPTANNQQRAGALATVKYALWSYASPKSRELLASLQELMAAVLHEVDQESLGIVSSCLKACEINGIPLQYVFGLCYADHSPLFWVIMEKAPLVTGLNCSSSQNGAMSPGETGDIAVESIPNSASRVVSGSPAVQSVIDLLMSTVMPESKDAEEACINRSDNETYQKLRRQAQSVDTYMANKWHVPYRAGFMMDSDRHGYSSIASIKVENKEGGKGFTVRMSFPNFHLRYQRFSRIREDFVARHRLFSLRFESGSTHDPTQKPSLSLVMLKGKPTPFTCDVRVASSCNTSATPSTTTSSWRRAMGSFPDLSYTSTQSSSTPNTNARTEPIEFRLGNRLRTDGNHYSTPYLRKLLSKLPEGSTIEYEDSPWYDSLGNLVLFLDCRFEDSALDDGCMIQ
ncbi:hypothetical protein BZG36_02670 [Bifiguratus adelaidae]|uniref:Uncharacterized protein n=1 Tax=Bifiguratus adelaidae TaxID=1938954 RepID=A0A261Y1K5_9FUNG|nr:hypothetical protein BZG36_02670 [Bifiguratus adelaidae]